MKLPFANWSGFRNRIWKDYLGFSDSSRDAHAERGCQRFAAGDQGGFTDSLLRVPEQKRRHNLPRGFWPGDRQTVQPSVHFKT